MLDQETIDGLRESRRGFKGVYPILYCAQHPEFIISGRHREKAGWDRRQPVDVEQWSKAWGVPHEVAHEMMRDRLNVQRRVPEEERAESLVRAAKALTEGQPRTGVASRLHALFPYLSERYIMDLLPKEFKDEKKAAAGKLGGSKSAELSSAEIGEQEYTAKAKEPSKSPEREKPEEKKEPYRKGLSPSLKQNLVGEFTPSQMSLIGALQYHGIPYKAEERIRVNKWICQSCGQKASDPPGEGTRCSKGHVAWEQVQLRADVLIEVTGKKISIEAEGRGTASADSERDALLREQGVLVFHAPNDFLDEWSEKLAEFLALIVGPS